MKRLLKVGLVLVVLAIVLVAGAVFYVLANINSLAKTGIERGGTYALGVPTTVQSVDLHLLTGQMSLSGLNVANPTGYASPSFLGLKSGDVAITLASVQSDVIEVPTFKLDGITVDLERKSGGSNYQTILDNLAKLKSSSSAPAPTGSSQKKLIIRDLELSNIKIHADLLGVGGPVGNVVGAVSKVDVPIDRIQLKDVGQTGTGVQGSGVTVEQLTSIIVQAVLSAAIEKGGGILPLDILNDLKGGVGSLGDLAKIPVSIIGKPGEAATKIGETAVKAVEGAGDQVKKAAEDVGKTIGDGLGGLIPGSKPKDKPPEPKKK